MEKCMRVEGFTGWKLAVESASAATSRFYNISSGLSAHSTTPAQSADWSAAEGGCSATYEHSFARDPKVDFFELLTTRAEDRLLADESYRQLLGEWRSCMKAAGYPAQSQISIVRGLVVVANRISEDGTQTAAPMMQSEIDAEVLPFTTAELVQITSLESLERIEQRLYDSDQHCQSTSQFTTRADVIRRRIADLLLVG